MSVTFQEQRLSWRSFAAGSAVSLFVHGMLFLAMTFAIRGCQKASSGQPGGETFREVGLFIVDGAEYGEAESGMQNGAGADEETRDVPSASETTVAEPSENPTNTPSPDRSAVPTDAPDVGNLLGSATASENGDSQQEVPRLIGPGLQAGSSSGGASGGSSVIQPAEAGGAKKLGGVGGPGETTFMNIVGVGKSFVYVIDTSSSMDGGRIRMAKTQLKASLRLLQPNQKFAVLFYNEYIEKLKLRKVAEQPMYFASDVNKQLALQQIETITPDHGTDHFPALQEALALKPDVIYFLTDGEEPSLSPAELRDVQALAGTTTIHVIKFGDGRVTTTTTSWLEKLARQCSGEFRELEVGR
ncbi:MAG: VWA domain-containing protein [Planctomycetaceae bacterium]|nr:VWA domain-containing protein [Planctomycetaceae bacterium]